jgi:hypothetical protein
MAVAGQHLNLCTRHDLPKLGCDPTLPLAGPNSGQVPLLGQFSPLLSGPAPLCLGHLAHFRDPGETQIAAI